MTAAYILVTGTSVILSASTHESLASWFNGSDWACFLLWHLQFHFWYAIYRLGITTFLKTLRTSERRVVRRAALGLWGSLLTFVGVASHLDVVEAFCWLAWVTPLAFLSLSCVAIAERGQHPFGLMGHDVTQPSSYDSVCKSQTKQRKLLTIYLIILLVIQAALSSTGLYRFRRAEPLLLVLLFCDPARTFVRWVSVTHKILVISYKNEEVTKRRNLSTRMIENIQSWDSTLFTTLCDFLGVSLGGIKWWLTWWNYRHMTMFGLLDLVVLLRLKETITHAVRTGTRIRLVIAIHKAVNSCKDVVEEEGVCVICRESLSSGKRLLQCPHRFHG